MSPIPMVIQYLSGHGGAGGKGTIQRRSLCLIQLLMFADNTVLLAETEEDLQHNVREFSKAVKQHRHAMSTGKTTTMVFSRKQVDCSVELDGWKVENVR